MKFVDDVVLITGGTGSFGRAMLMRLVRIGCREVRILSRDEKKQDELRQRFAGYNVKFYLGDVRDPASLVHPFNGVDYVFHAAALKQVPSCEFYPIEAVKTNIVGTENVLAAAVAAHVKTVVVLSTDKAVYPVNAMGVSKAMMEKVAVAKALSQDTTNICVTRYGNVMASRGSVIPRFLSQYNSGSPFTITDPNMTRFMMTLEEAISLVLYAFENSSPGDIFVQKAPSISLNNLVLSVEKFLNIENYPRKVIGTRHGEKLFEVLLGREEIAKAVEADGYFRVPADARNLDYSVFVERGRADFSEAVEYTSHNCVALSVSEMVEILHKNVDTQGVLLNAN